MYPQDLDQLKRDLRRHEGFREYPYDDKTGRPAYAERGKITVGYGRNLEDVPLSRRIAEDMLDEDIAEVGVRLHRKLPWLADLDTIREGVLFNMAFNLGIGGLLKFVKTLHAFKARDWTTAAAEMEDSNWYAQVGPRARELKQRVLTGRIEE